MKAGTSGVVMHQFASERGFAVVRIYLGLGLLIRGIFFFVDPSFVGNLVGSPGPTALVPHLIALGHTLGGALLALGLYTRVAATVQLVPVLGALLAVHAGGSLASADQSLEFSALVAVLLVLFAAFGPGPWSLDARRRG